MLPPEILRRIASIQHELAAILAALPDAGGSQAAESLADLERVIAALPAHIAPLASRAPEASAAAGGAPPWLVAAALADAPLPGVAPASAPAPAWLVAEPAVAKPAAPQSPVATPEQRWSFLPDARYRVVGPNPFQPGRNQDLFAAVVERYGDRPFSFADLEAVASAARAKGALPAPTRAVLIAFLQVAGRQRGSVEMAGGFTG